MIRKKKKDYLIQSVSLACTLLEQFGGAASELKISELSRLLCVSKNNVFRLLATLESHNFIEKNSKSGAYQLGLTSLKLGESCIKSRRLLQEARHSLEAVSRQSTETAFLAVLTSGGLVCGDVVETALPVKVVTQIGSCFPLYSTAAGRVILAFCSDEERNALIGKEYPDSYVKKRNVCQGAWMEERENIRKKGFAVSIGAFEAGANAVAAAVRNHASQVIGVISVAGPNFRLSHERINDEVAPFVVKAAMETSLRMGYGEPASLKPVSQGKRLAIPQAVTVPD